MMKKLRNLAIFLLITLVFAAWTSAGKNSETDSNAEHKIENNVASATLSEIPAYSGEPYVVLLISSHEDIHNSLN